MFTPLIVTGENEELNEAKDEDENKESNGGEIRIEENTRDLVVTEGGETNVEVQMVSNTKSQEKMKQYSGKKEDTGKNKKEKKKKEEDEEEFDDEFLKTYDFLEELNAFKKVLNKSNPYNGKHIQTYMLPLLVNTRTHIIINLKHIFCIRLQRLLGHLIPFLECLLHKIPVLLKRRMKYDFDSLLKDSSTEITDTAKKILFQYVSQYAQHIRYPQEVIHMEDINRLTYFVQNINEEISTLQHHMHLLKISYSYIESYLNRSIRTTAMLFDDIKLFEHYAYIMEQFKIIYTCIKERDIVMLKSELSNLKNFTLTITYLIKRGMLCIMKLNQRIIENLRKEKLYKNDLMCSLVVNMFTYFIKSNDKASTHIKECITSCNDLSIVNNILKHLEEEKKNLQSCFNIAVNFFSDSHAKKGCVKNLFNPTGFKRVEVSDTMAEICENLYRLHLIETVHPSLNNMFSYLNKIIHKIECAQVIEASHENNSGNVDTLIDNQQTPTGGINFQLVNPSQNNDTSSEHNESTQSNNAYTSVFILEQQDMAFRLRFLLNTLHDEKTNTWQNEIQESLTHFFNVDLNEQHISNRDTKFFLTDEDLIYLCNLMKKFHRIVLTHVMCEIENIAISETFNLLNELISLTKRAVYLLYMSINSFKLIHTRMQNSINNDDEEMSSLNVCYTSLYVSLLFFRLLFSEATM